MSLYCRLLGHKWPYRWTYNEPVCCVRCGYRLGRQDAEHGSAAA